MDQWSRTTSHQNGRKINCNTANYVPFVVPVLTTSSSTSSSLTFPTSSSQDIVTTTEIPSTRRSESTIEFARGNPSRESTEIENPNKNDDDDEELQSDELQGVPDWLREFKHGLVDESVPDHRDTSSSSHELPSEPRAKVVSGSTIFFSLREGPTLRHLFENQDYKGCLQKTHWDSRAQSG